MPTICRLIQLSSNDAASLVADPGALADRVQSATIYSDVYRYWHAIEYLLARHRPGSAGARWLASGVSVPAGRPEVPSARVLSVAQVNEIDADVRDIQPEELAAHYDAAALDAAKIYPSTWVEWEEDFDPLGQVLEHYSFLQQAVAQCARASAALLLYFDILDEGTV